MVVEILVPGPEWCPARQKTRTQRVPITGEESLLPFVTEFNPCISAGSTSSVERELCLKYEPFPSRLNNDNRDKLCGVVVLLNSGHQI